MAGKLKIKLVKSTIGSTEKQKGTIAALGLKKLQQEVTHNDSPQIRGMIHKMSHLLSVEEA